jgi:tetratricopeptide (TPR) repeat protein
MAIDPKQVQAAFLEAVAATPEERAGVLDRVCAGDAELRRRVELLMRAHDDSGDLPSAAGKAEDTGAYESKAAHAAPRADLQPGDIFAGRYKLREKLGEGGMGIVWVADQTTPVQRRIALKVIKSSEDSLRLLARFEQERQALALMDHPNIAKVLDAGVSDNARPYFVMELIKGVPLTKYCDQAKLTPRERLELFVPVCQAVQHAHQKGIIHRDLKPSNILIGLYDGRPVPKVIDFGVAKATGPRLGEQSIYTEVGAMIGTLEYMSPEQAALNNLDIDTRSDVYSLGVILYELLTGSVPFSRKDLKAAGFAEMLRIIKEVEPPKPSTWLSGSGTLPSVAALRHTEPKKLTRLVRGELDWIVMKCLEKDRSRRFETANGLARDIERYLADEVIEARPPSARYQLRKFVRRHKGQVVATVAVVVALVVGVAAVVTVQLRANRDLAAKNAELADEQQKVQARFDLAVKAIQTFHTGVSEDMLLKNEEFKELRTKLLKEAGRFYADLEKLLAGQSDEKSRKTLAAGYFQLAELTDKIGDMTQALGMHRKALAVRRELADVAGADVETRLDVARSLIDVGLLLSVTGDQAGAMSAYEEALELAQRVEAEDSTDAVRSVLAESHSCIGGQLSSTGKPAVALEEFGKALAIRQKLADHNPALIKAQLALARSHERIGGLIGFTGKPAEALEEFGKALAIRQKLADHNPAVTMIQLELAHSHRSSGIMLSQIGNPTEALEAFGKALEIQQKLAVANPAVTDVQFELAGLYHLIGVVLMQTGKPAQALEAYHKALAIYQKLADANLAATYLQKEVARTYGNIGYLLSHTGKTAEALEAHRKTLAIRQKLAVATPAITNVQFELAWTHNKIGVVLLQTGNPTEAMEEYRKALGICQKLVPASPTVAWYQNELAQSHDNLGRLHAQQNRFAEAFSAFDAALAIRRKLAQADLMTTQRTSALGDSYASRGWARVRAGQPSEAAADLRQAVELWAKDPAPMIGERFERARARALLAGLGGDPKSGVSSAEAKTFADQSVGALRDAVKAGWGNLAELKEPDFEAVRGRPDFQKLFAEVEAKAKQRETAPPEKK